MTTRAHRSDDDLNKLSRLFSHTTTLTMRGVALYRL